MSERISDKVIHYHERTKHHPLRYARSPGRLDWANEPDLFRRYEGARLIGLPLLEHDPEQVYTALFERQNNTPQDFSIENIASFLEMSLGLSAWKSYQSTSWPLRINPSSGNLHPTEAYLVLPPEEPGGRTGGIFHYNPFFHALEERAAFENEFWATIRTHFGKEGFLVGLSSIFWRESWKYGERAFRYCNHDIGHAIACLSLSANLLGWKVTYLHCLSDDDIERVLGFKKTEWKRFEEERPELLLFVHRSDGVEVPRDIPDEIIRRFDSLSYAGKPNPLSGDPVEWEVIDAVSGLTFKPKTPEKRYHYIDFTYLEKNVPFTATEIIRRRRSALDFDGESTLSKEHFFGMLDRTIPRSCCAPFDLEPGDISVHLLLFVHRVEGLDAGLYFLIRNAADADEIKSRCRKSFLWQKAEGAPGELPLYLLETRDFRRTAIEAGCFQNIAGEGVFSAAMIGRFRDRVEGNPYLYRLLHWEAGMIGQVLYLEAEAHLRRGTGMGCFFDDSVHSLLGIADNSFQDLYHFAVGKPVEDIRLKTLPPYSHLRERK